MESSPSTAPPQTRDEAVPGRGSQQAISPAYVRFVGGLTSWSVAAGMQQVLFTWLILGELRESSGWLGTAQMCQMLPLLLLLLVGGAAADHLDRPRLLSRLHLAGGLGSVLLGVAVVTGRLHIGLLITWALVFGSLQAFAQPARDALLFDVAGGRDLMRAVTRATFMQFGGQALGTALAGLAGMYGYASSLWLQGCVFAAGALPLAGLAVAAPPPAERPPGPAHLALREGLHTVWSSDRLRIVALLVAANGLFYMGPFFVLCPLLLRDFYGGDVRNLSLVLMGFTFGTMAGSLLVLARGGVRRKGRGFLLALLGVAGCLVVIAARPRFEIFAAVLVCWGIFHSVFFNTSRTLFQEAAPIDRRARVNSIHSLGLLGMAPISNLAAGWSGHALGPLMSCAGAGAAMVCIVAAAWTFTGVRRLE